MGIFKEPLDVDFYVNPKSLSSTEEKEITDYIKADKEKREKLHPTKKKSRTQKITQ